jgi:hypothetical protein
MNILNVFLSPVKLYFLHMLVLAPSFSIQASLSVIVQSNSTQSRHKSCFPLDLFRTHTATFYQIFIIFDRENLIGFVLFHFPVQLTFWVFHRAHFGGDEKIEFYQVWVIVSLMSVM